MSGFVDIILQSGRSAIDLALYILLPIMVVMLTFMRMLEAKGILDRVVDWVAPFLRPFGIHGLGIFAMIQILTVSFAAPVATLAMMDKRGISDRHIAATLAMVLGMAQANVLMPMAAMGLQAPLTLVISMICGIAAAAATYHIFARHLTATEVEPDLHPQHPVAEDTKGVLNVINRAGGEALKITISAIPMLLLALLLVNLLRAGGLIGLLETWLTPLFTWFDLPSTMLLPVVSKYIAGGTAMMGVMSDLLAQGLVTVEELNRVAGFLLNPLDLVGVAILIAAGPRVAAVAKPAIYGALVALLLRTLLHGILF